MLLVAAQGREASFHFVAARKYFGDSVQLVSCASFGEVLRQLAVCDYGVVAVQNSISGEVHEVNDLDVSVRELVAAHEAGVVGEVSIPIEQCLIALPEASLADITRVYSHDAALKQCGRFLDEHLPGTKRVEHEDTAGAVADVKKWANPHYAAIASRAAAELHGMQVLAAGMGNDAHSVTQFLVVRAARVPARRAPTANRGVSAAHSSYASS